MKTLEEAVLPPQRLDALVHDFTAFLTFFIFVAHQLATTHSSHFNCEYVKVNMNVDLYSALS